MASKEYKEAAHPTYMRNETPTLGAVVYRHPDISEHLHTSSHRVTPASGPGSLAKDAGTPASALGETYEELRSITESSYQVLPLLSGVVRGVGACYSHASAAPVESLGSRRVWRCAWVWHVSMHHPGTGMRLAEPCLLSVNKTMSTHSVSLILSASRHNRAIMPRPRRLPSSNWTSLST